MDGPEFRQRGREMVDYIVDYMENISDRRVTPNIEPGYLQELIPKEPPQKPEEWEDVMKDVEDKIMVGVRGKGGKELLLYTINRIDDPSRSWFCLVKLASSPQGS